jgi:hypothetical protein
MVALSGSRLRECMASPSFGDSRVKVLDTLYALAATRRA